MYRLKNPVMEYAWGSVSDIPELLGEQPTGRPQAELWMGAHPSASSEVEVDGQWRSLRQLIESDPVGQLGDAVYRRYGAELPYLLKYLAVSRPLSVQVHPDDPTARSGFEAEQGQAGGAEQKERTYKDPRGKPELVVPMTPFDQLCGFRPPQQAALALDRLGGVKCSGLVEILRSGGENAQRRALELFFSLPRPERLEMAAEVITSATSAGDDGSDTDAELVRSISVHFHDDGIVVALLLNHLSLERGQAMYVSPGTLHAYLHGSAVEIMANSDNVIRGGLTPKYVDVDALLEVTDTSRQGLELGAGAANAAQAPGSSSVTRFEAPVASFGLERVDLRGSQELFVFGPEILFCTAGNSEVGQNARTRDAGIPAVQLSLSRGSSCFVSADSGSYLLSGEGEIFRATVGDLSIA